MVRWNNIEKSRVRIWIKAVILPLLVGFTSCHLQDRYPDSVHSALDKAGENRKELVKVIEYYSKHPRDSLKLKAACFLIGNMPGHAFRKRSGIFKAVFDSAATYDILKGRTYFAEGMNKLKQAYPVEFYADTVVEDIKHVSADFLIENIELAFKAYHNIPQEYRLGFDHFLKTILPYRVSDEPLEAGTREKLYQKYQWVYQELQAGEPLQHVVHAMIDSMQLNIAMGNGYPGRFSISQVEKVGFGRCPDLVNYAAHAFRAVGIPASFDFTPHWGNDYGRGHSWLTINAPGLFMPVDVTSNKRMNELYRKASLPKAYRYTYARNEETAFFGEDVTAVYKPPNRIEIANRWNKDVAGKQVWLTVFDRNRLWAPVGMAESVNKESSCFKNISSHVVFMAGYNDQSGTFQPLNYPFIVDDKQQVQYLNPEVGGTIDTVTLLRKYPPFSIRGGGYKLSWIKQVNSLKVQGSNDSSFNPHHDLLDVENFNSTHVKTLPLSYKGTYKYYRVVSSRPEVWLATLRVVSKHKPEQVQYINSWWSFYDEKLKDSDPLSYAGGPEFQARYIYSRPVKVEAIELQPRNDNNHINPGDTYRLMYWDKGWQPVGTSRVARDTMLVYHDLPENALYWLRNLSRGREEHIFTITDQGKQFWPGVSNYSTSFK